MNFKNIDACSDDSVESWGFEGVLAVLQRGDLMDWHKLYVALDNNQPSGISETINEALDIMSLEGIRPGVTAVFRLLLERKARGNTL